MKNSKMKKPTKPKQHWRKNVDWSAAGRKAHATRLKNLKHEKKGNVKTQKKVKPQKKPTPQKQVKQHGKKTEGFGNYRVNRDELVKKLQASKKTEFAPTEVVSLTWQVIKSAKASANNGRKHK